MNRILTTHAGSLTRPADLLAFLAARERGEAVDEGAYLACLSRAVDDTVRRQVEAGIDLVDDGEMGKATWITYLYERVSGLEPRMVPVEGGNILPPSRDRLAFPEFYAEHDAEMARQVVNQIRLGSRGSRGRRPRPAARPRRACGSAPARSRTTGPRCRATSRRLRSALEGVDVVDAFLPVVAPASVYWLHNEYYPSDEEFVFAVADALHEEYRAIVEAGLAAPGRRCRPRARVRLDPLAGRLARGLPALGGAARRRAQPRAPRHPRGPHPLPHLLRQLARPTPARPSATGDPRSRAPRQRRCVLHRAGQPASRARMADLGGRRSFRTARS